MSIRAVGYTLCSVLVYVEDDGHTKVKKQFAFRLLVFQKWHCLLCLFVGGGNGLRRAVIRRKDEQAFAT